MSLNSSTNSSLRPAVHSCLSKTNVSISTALLATYLLLLPLFIFVLFVGYRRWRKHRSAAAATTTSHSDIFTFNMAVLEIFCVPGSCFFIYGGYTNRLNIMMVGLCMLVIISPGQTLFHLLTCVERYLAVVHPITYLGLRQAGGVRIRNISIGCVWLLCFGSAGVSMACDYFYLIFTFLILVLSFIVVSFCSVSVLCALIRPGPGEVGGNRERVDQSKQRAFYTMMAIMGALMLRFLSRLVIAVLMSLTLSGNTDTCLLWTSETWFCLPSSLVLPLLFLHRAGKLPACKHKHKSTLR